MMLKNFIKNYLKLKIKIIECCIEQLTLHLVFNDLWGKLVGILSIILTTEGSLFKQAHFEI